MPNPSPLRRLLYISTSRVPITQELCDSILADSRRNNARADVTGLLVTGGRRFLQALEGPPTQVTATFRRIERDPRHFALVVLRDETVTERAFADWSMGHCAGAVVGEDGSAGDLLAPIADPSLRAYFAGFTGLHQATE